jgi:DNA-binding MarR family transcriptional regulator
MLTSVSTDHEGPEGTTSPGDVATDVQDGITRLNRRLRQARPLGEITQTQMSALVSLEIAGALTPTELAEIERVQPPTMTRIVAKLESNGWVTRAPHPSDGRQSILSATDAGRSVLAEQRLAKDAWLSLRLAELSEEERQTLRAAAEILVRVARDAN